MNRCAGVRWLGIAALAAPLLADCAVNPATGKRQLMLIGEDTERELGRSYDRSVTAEMGLYDDEELQAWVHGLGRRLALRSERPELDWTFRVVDDPTVNAFALPGGYIYLTRGILAHLRNEAELAAVVGHEIGHVTARHGASQMSKAQLAQFGLGGLAIVAPEYAQRFGGVAQQALGVAFLKFGRDDERQADDLGLRYLVSAGYDARPMADVFDMLDRVSAASGAGPVPGWLSTHPAPENRRAQAEERIAALNYDFSKTTLGTEGYLERIDGLAFGDDPRQGYFEGRRFIHPEMAFRMEFPEGYELQNMRQAVVGASAEGDAIVELGLTTEPTPAAALEKFFAEGGLVRTGPAMGSISGLPTAGDGFVAETAQGKLRGRVGFVQHGGRVFRLLGFAAEHRFAAHEAAIRRALSSFDRLTDRRALEVQPRRLRIVRAERAMTIEALGAAHGATVPGDTLALLNRLEDGQRLVAGTRYKVVVGAGPPEE